jgi:cell division septal protein FtsQ
MESLGDDGRGGRAASPPASSRLTLKPRGNRRVPKAPKSAWARVPKPREIANACGRALRRSLSTIVALGIVGAVGGTAWAGYHFVTTSSRFAITTIEIHGAHHLDADRVRADLPVRVGDNVFAAPLGDVTAHLRTNPWIGSADARRVLPHAIVVEIRERTPVAVVELGAPYLADASGRPFKRADADEAAALPIVSGIERARYLADPDAVATTTRDALAALARWRDRADRPAIASVRVDARGALAFVAAIDDGGDAAIDVGRPDAELPRRLAAFDAAWGALSDSERARVARIQVRSDHATIVFHP